MASSSSNVHDRVTLADVARVAGVSKITVSRALRGSELVKPAVRHRIAEVAAEMGYRINLAARDLRLKRRMRIAVVVDVSASDDRPLYDPYPLAILGGVLQECAAAGFAVVLTTSDPKMSDEVLDTSGVIVLGQGANHATVRSLTGTNLPLAVWGADDGVEREIGAVVVGSDNRQGGMLAAQHLQHRGCQRLVFLGDTSHAELADRAQGFKDGLLGGTKIVAAQNADFTREGGRRALREVITSGITFDGVFAGSDLVALGAIDALRDAGGASAANVAIVGYDDAPAAAAHAPRLTTIRQDWTEGGKLLARALFARLDSQRFTEPPSRMLPVQLIERET